MKTCKDCFHYDVCQYHITEETGMTINECSNKFVDKDDVVEVVRCIKGHPKGHPDPKGERGECGLKKDCLKEEIHKFSKRLKECLPPWLHIYVDTVGKEIEGE